MGAPWGPSFCCLRRYEYTLRVSSRESRVASVISLRGPHCLLGGAFRLRMTLRAGSKFGACIDRRDGGLGASVTLGGKHGHTAPPPTAASAAASASTAPQNIAFERDVFASAASSASSALAASE